MRRFSMLSILVTLLLGVRGEGEPRQTTVMQSMVIIKGMPLSIASDSQVALRPPAVLQDTEDPTLQLACDTFQRGAQLTGSFWSSLTSRKANTPTCELCHKRPRVQGANQVIQIPGTVNLEVASVDTAFQLLVEPRQRLAKVAVTLKFKDGYIECWRDTVQNPRWGRYPDPQKLTVGDIKGAFGSHFFVSPQPGDDVGSKRFITNEDVSRYQPRAPHPSTPTH